MNEPTSYKQALQQPDRGKWQEAIDDELNAHKKNDSFKIIKFEKGMNVIGCRWVFNKKKDEYGNIKKYKARLVAKGFTQQEGVDYDETFAPVLKYKSMRMILALSTFNKKTNIKQLDVKTAFLNATVNENIYMKIPEGMKINDSENKVIKLNKALYGLKQASNEWNNEINNFLTKELSFTRCIKDTCIYIKTSKNNNNIIFGIFVDDIISSYVDEDENEYNIYINKLKNKYDLLDIGNINHILGMHVSKQSNSLYIDQKSYITDKLKSFNMLTCTSSPTPSSLDKLTKNVDVKMIESENEYRSIVGSLIYASISTRPDITHAVNMVSRHMHAPNHTHMIAAKRILKYLSGTQDLCLKYDYDDNDIKNKKVSIEAYCDADWGGDTDDRKSTTGYCVFINKKLISWHTHKQPTVALSSAEAELMSGTDVVKEIMWLRMMLTELNYEVDQPIIIMIDNQSAIKIAENDVEHTRSKHIDIKYNFIRNEIRDKNIELRWISTRDQIADIFTKSLVKEIFEKLRDQLISKL